jgi:hypothetical protein
LHYFHFSPLSFYSYPISSFLFFLRFITLSLPFQFSIFCTPLSFNFTVLHRSPISSSLYYCYYYYYYYYYCYNYYYYYYYYYY